MSKATDQCKEYVNFLLELRSISMEMQTAASEDIRDCGYSIEELLIKYDIIERKDLE